MKARSDESEDGTARRTGKLAEALLAGENRILELVARGGSLSKSLDGLCRLIEELSGGSLCGILLVDRTGSHVEHGAAPSLPTAYNQAIHGRVITADAGPCGMAACLKVQVIAGDLTSDNRWANDWRTLALAHGLRACWSTPILASDGKVLGTFAIYWREPRSPTPQDHQLIEQTTHLAAVAIERQHAEDELRRSAAYLAEAQKLSLTGSFGWRVASGELIWSAETFCILGYDRSVKPTSELVLKRVHPADVSLVQQTLDRAVRDKADFDFEHRLLMPDGAIKHVHVVARPSQAESGSLEFVGAVMDITERKQDAETVRASEQLARGQVEALKRTLDALAQEADPDRLLEHVLRTIVEQTKAHSIAAWNRNEDGARFDMIAIIENGRYQAREEAVHPAGRLSMLPQHHPVWREVLRTGQHGMMEDIDQAATRMCIGSSDWHRVVEDIDTDPAFTVLMNHLREMGVRAVLFVPILVAGQVAGILAVRFQEKRTFRREEIELTRALAHQAMLAIQLTRLSAQSRQAAVTDERNRLARDIHDTLAQGFTGVIMQLEAAKGAAVRHDLAEVTVRVERAGNLARSGLGDARRSVRALRTRSLLDGTLCMALEDLLKRMTEGTNLHAEFHVEGEIRSVAPESEEVLLRIAQEALTNTIKHAQARNFRATLNLAADKAQLQLVDDGRGFDAHAEHDGFGLTGMKERVDRLGGEFIVRSKPCQGTEIVVILKS